MTSWDHPEWVINMIEGYDSPKISGLIKPTYNAPRCFEIDKLFTLIKGRHNEGWNRYFGSTNVLVLDGHIGTHLPPEIGELAKRQEHSLEVPGQAQ